MIGSSTPRRGQQCLICRLQASTCANYVISCCMKIVDIYQLHAAASRTSLDWLAPLRGVENVTWLDRPRHSVDEPMGHSLPTPRRGEQCLICRLHAVAWRTSFDWFVPRHGVEPLRRVLDRSLWPEAPSIGGMSDMLYTWELGQNNTTFALVCATIETLESAF